MKSIYTFSVVLTLFTVMSCEVDSAGINVIEAILETDHFDEIRLESSSDIRIIQSDEFKVILRGREKDVEDVEVRVVNHKLTIEENREHPNDFLIKIYVPELSELDCTGSSYVYGESYFTQDRNFDIRVSGSGELDFAIDTDDVDLNLTGSGYIYLEGNVQTLDAEIVGSGWLRSFGMNSELTDVRIEGSGSAEVTVETDLDIFITGSGNVYYKGHPDINAKITGSGEVINAN